MLRFFKNVHGVQKILERVWIALLMASAAIIAWHPVRESDPFWHLALGREVLRQGSRTILEPFAFIDFSRPCTVPEWLWGISTYGLYVIFGWVGLGLLTIALAALAAYVVAKLVLYVSRGSYPGVTMLVSSATVVALMSRLRLRPQAVCMVLLPAFLWLTLRYIRARDSTRTKLGAALVLIAVVWAQLHGSFVLAPLVFLILVVPSAWSLRATRKLVRKDATIFMLILSSLLTSAYGLDIISYIGSHNSGYAANHILDMLPSNWLSFNVLNSPYTAALVGLWAMGITGMIAKGRIKWPELLLALLGVILLSSANRFIATAAILTSPIAVLGGKETAKHFNLKNKHQIVSGLLLAACSVVSLSLLFWGGLATHVRRGPIGMSGLSSGVHPVRAHEILKTLPNGTNVLTAYSAGAPLGFWMDGQIRTYVDGRTPLYFDDTDYAVSREILHSTNPNTLKMGIIRYNLGAAVVKRNSAACNHLSKIWSPVSIEPNYTTFLPPGVIKPIEGISPCGEDFLIDNACANGGMTLDRSIALLKKLKKDPFIDYLLAARILYCGGNKEKAMALIDDEKTMWNYRKHRRRLLIRGLFQKDKIDEAISLMINAIDDDTQVIKLLGLLRIGTADLSKVRKFLEKAVKKLEYTAQPKMLVDLALICARQGDAECARFHGIRAAVNGEAKVLPALNWLKKNHPSSYVRSDAKKWADTLNEKMRADER